MVKIIVSIRVCRIPLFGKTEMNVCDYHYSHSKRVAIFAVAVLIVVDSRCVSYQLCAIDCVLSIVRYQLLLGIHEHQLLLVCGII